MEPRALISEKDVGAIVKALLKENFPKIRIESVLVREVSGEFANRTFAITVVFEDKHGSFNPADLQTLPRHIIGELTKVHESGFPILSFIAKSELEKMKSEAG